MITRGAVLLGAGSAVIGGVKLIDTGGVNAAAISAANALKVDGSAVTQPVSLATAPSTPVTGTFWQATQPVSGTFYQATQPVSLATNTPDVTDRAARLLGVAKLVDTGGVNQVAISAANALKVDGSAVTQPVSGTFFQTTQPVSLATAPSTPVTGTFWQATQPVSGTFWQATQPVSIAAAVVAAPATAGTGTLTSVAGSATSVTLLALNASRKGASFYNDSTVTLYLSLSATASSTTVYTVQVPPNGFFEVPYNGWIYIGPVTGMWTSATGSARVTELT